MYLQTLFRDVYVLIDGGCQWVLLDWCSLSNIFWPHLDDNVYSCSILVRTHVRQMMHARLKALEYVSFIGSIFLDCQQRMTSLAWLQARDSIDAFDHFCPLRTRGVSQVCLNQFKRMLWRGWTSPNDWDRMDNRNKTESHFRHKSEFD
jgi:hypothetical protein